VASSSSIAIGSATTGDRNLISGNSQAGIQIIGTSGNTGNVIKGNLIGTDAQGSDVNPPIPNGVGIALSDGTSNSIGAGAAGDGDVSCGNTTGGITITCQTTGQVTQHVVQGNIIGASRSGVAERANGGSGISIKHCKGNTIGGTTIGSTPGDLGQGNLITGST